MKDVVKKIHPVQGLKPREMAAALVLHFLACGGGFICARAVVLDRLLPFGLSFLAGCSLPYTPAAAIGVFVGYFLPAAGSSGFRYLAILFAVLAVRFLLSGYRSLSENPIFLSLLCLFSHLIISTVSAFGVGGSLIDTAIEALLAAGGAYFVCRSFCCLKKDAFSLSADELASVLTVMGMLLVGLGRFHVNGIVPGHILGILLILTASKYGGMVSGSICGIVLSFALFVGGAAPVLAVIYAFFGLAAGLFAPLGKYLQLTVLLLFVFAGSGIAESSLLTAQAVIETSLGSMLFLLLPRRAGIAAGRFFSVNPKLAIPTGIQRSVTMRLTMASGALNDVSETVEQVSRELAKINSPDFGGILSGIEEDACAGCKLRVHCWETKRQDTIHAIMEMTKAVKQGSRTPEDRAPEEFQGRCIRVARIGASAYRHYSDYTSRLAAESRIDEVRSVVSDQFNGISAMLSDLASDFSHDEQFDSAAAETAAAALKNLNLYAEECGSRVDKFGRLSLEFKLRREPRPVINKMQIMKLLSAVCERDFDIPTVNETGSSIFLTLREHAAITVDVGVDQRCASGSSICGDAYKYFLDGRGHFLMVLSDGMGTGGRAAVDGAMASGLMGRLIKAGFGYDCSLKILNSSMLFKSTDESLATVDIASIDLYTGMTELYKAGAAPTVVRRSGKSGKAESTSLPAGILREITFDKAAIKCRTGDIIVLVSDGATTDGTDWIRDELEAWKDGTAQDLAERLCEGAARRRADDHEDDITVMTAILNPSV